MRKGELQKIEDDLNASLPEELKDLLFEKTKPKRKYTTKAVKLSLKQKTQYQKLMAKKAKKKQKGEKNDF